jgi:Rrf2 family nitric oxide-sensitive transcriptional repressor
MRLTAFTDFGFRTLMRLAGEPDRILTTDAIAREFSISRNHLNKVVQNLAAAGLIRTVRGAHGGIQLARPAAEIKLGDVVRHLELSQALVECFRDDGGACVLTPRCQLKSKLAAATRAFLNELDRSTLADCAYPAPPRRAA